MTSGACEAVEGEVEAGDRRLLGETLAPICGPQPPADLVTAGEVAGARRIDALEPAEAHDLAAVRVLDDPEGVAVIALEADDASIGSVPFLGVWTPPRWVMTSGRFMTS